MLLPDRVFEFLRTGMEPAARKLVECHVDESDAISLAVRQLCQTIVWLRTARLTPGEVSAALSPMLKAAASPSQSVVDITTDPGSMPFFPEQP